MYSAKRIISLWSKPWQPQPSQDCLRREAVFMSLHFKRWISMTLSFSISISISHSHTHTVAKIAHYCWLNWCPILTQFSPFAPTKYFSIIYQYIFHIFCVYTEMYAIKSQQIHYSMTGCACCSLQNAILLLDESTNELEMSQKWPEI